MNDSFNRVTRREIPRGKGIVSLRLIFLEHRPDKEPYLTRNNTPSTAALTFPTTNTSNDQPQAARSSQVTRQASERIRSENPKKHDARLVFGVDRAPNPTLTTDATSVCKLRHLLHGPPGLPCMRVARFPSPNTASGTQVSLREHRHLRQHRVKTNDFARHLTMHFKY